MSSIRAREDREFTCFMIFWIYKIFHCLKPFLIKDTSGMRWETSGCVRNALWAKTSLMKYFVSPNFPMKFAESATCTWRLRAAPGHKIKINWPVFWMDGCNDGNQMIGNGSTA